MVLPKLLHARLCLLHLLFMFITSARCKYLGCFFRYSPSAAVVINNHDRTINENMTVAMCSKICVGGKYDMYGLQNGNSCSCGVKGKSFNETEAVKGHCSIPCAGAATCGSSFVIAMYNLSSFVGCYNYSAEDKMNFGGYLPNLTRETCLEKCQSFSLFGLTGGDRCYCRSHLPNSSSVDRQFCRELPCQGEETCGAEQYVAIWDYSVEVEDNTETTMTFTPGSTTTLFSSSTPFSAHADGIKVLTTDSTDGRTGSARTFIFLYLILGCLVAIAIAFMLWKYLSKSWGKGLYQVTLTRNGSNELSEDVNEL